MVRTTKETREPPKVASLTKTKNIKKPRVQVPPRTNPQSPVINYSTSGTIKKKPNPSISDLLAEPENPLLEYSKDTTDSKSVKSSKPHKDAKKKKSKRAISDDSEPEPVVVKTKKEAPSTTKSLRSPDYMSPSYRGDSKKSSTTVKSKQTVKFAKRESIMAGFSTENSRSAMHENPSTEMSPLQINMKEGSSSIQYCGRKQQHMIKKEPHQQSSSIIDAMN
jgi:hypothetical protein